MATLVQTFRSVCFGNFQLDLTSRELRKHGVRLRLQDQPFSILEHLLERAGEVVSREELRQKLWPSDTYVDFDAGLNSAMNRLRNALGDTAEHAVFIQTVSRRGYRFIAPVEFQAVPLSPMAPGQPPRRADAQAEPISRGETPPPRSITTATGIALRRIGAALYRWSDLVLARAEDK